MLCLAKRLTRRYLPMAATLASGRIFQAFLGASADGRRFAHGQTCTGNASHRRAGDAGSLERERILEALGPAIAQRHGELERLRPLAAVGDIRRFGLSAGVELVQDRATRAPFPPVERRGMRVCHSARSRGVFLRPLGDTIVLMSLTPIPESVITQLIDAVDCGIRETCG
jgi:adenosylmethionine-8-amino-7-oxononanoate aminotransferase